MNHRYVLGQLVWMLRSAMQLIATLGTRSLWVVQCIRLFIFIGVVWSFFLPHLWWYLTSALMICHVSYRSSATTRQRNLRHILEAEGVDLADVMPRTHFPRAQRLIRRHVRSTTQKDSSNNKHTNPTNAINRTVEATWSTQSRERQHPTALPHTHDAGESSSEESAGRGDTCTENGNAKACIARSQPNRHRVLEANPGVYTCMDHTDNKSNSVHGTTSKSGDSFRHCIRARSVHNVAHAHKRVIIHAEPQVATLRRRGGGAEEDTPLRPNMAPLATAADASAAPHANVFWTRLEQFIGPLALRLNPADNSSLKRSLPLARRPAPRGRPTRAQPVRRARAVSSENEASSSTATAVVAATGITGATELPGSHRVKRGKDQGSESRQGWHAKGHARRSESGGDRLVRPGAGSGRVYAQSKGSNSSGSARGRSDGNSNNRNEDNDNSRCDSSSDYSPCMSSEVVGDAAQAVASSSSSHLMRCRDAHGSAQHRHGDKNERQDKHCMSERARYYADLPDPSTAWSSALTKEIETALQQVNSSSTAPHASHDTKDKHGHNGNTNTDHKDGDDFSCSSATFATSKNQYDDVNMARLPECSTGDADSQSAQRLWRDLRRWVSATLWLPRRLFRRWDNSQEQQTGEGEKAITIKEVEQKGQTHRSRRNGRNGETKEFCAVQQRRATPANMHPIKLCTRKAHPMLLDEDDEDEDEEDRLNVHNRATLDIVLPVPLDTVLHSMNYNTRATAAAADMCSGEHSIPAAEAARELWGSHSQSHTRRRHRSNSSSSSGSSGSHKRTPQRSGNDTVHNYPDLCRATSSRRPRRSHSGSTHSHSVDRDKSHDTTHYSHSRAKSAKQQRDFFGSHSHTKSRSLAQRGHAPLRRRKFKIAIVLVGVAWIIGSHMWSTMVARVLAARGYLVFCPDYRNFPQTTMEGMVLDVSDAIAWVLNNAERYNGDLADVTVLGQSAGAHLTMMSIISQAQMAAHQFNTDVNKETVFHAAPPSPVAYNVPRYNPQKSIRCYIGLSGFYDVEGMISHFDRRGLYRNVLYQIAGHRKDLPRYSIPAYFDRRRWGDVGEELPDNFFDFMPRCMYFLHGDKDKSAPPSESAKMVYTLRHAQGVWRREREVRLAAQEAHRCRLQQSHCATGATCQSAARVSMFWSCVHAPDSALFGSVAKSNHSSSSSNRMSNNVVRTVFVLVHGACHTDMIVEECITAQDSTCVAFMCGAYGSPRKFARAFLSEEEMERRASMSMGSSACAALHTVSMTPDVELAMAVPPHMFSWRMRLVRMFCPF